MQGLWALNKEIKNKVEKNGEEWFGNGKKGRMRK